MKIYEKRLFFIFLIAVASFVILTSCDTSTPIPPTPTPEPTATATATPTPQPTPTATPDPATFIDEAEALFRESDLEGAVTLFEGELDDWEVDETDLSIRVVSAASQWAQRTLSKQAGTCRWKVFKGTEWQYAGVESWCDRTYSRCSALTNTANFGGFRFLPDLIDKDIWWGRSPKDALT